MTRRDWLAAGLTIAAAIVCCFAGVVLHGKSIVYSDNFNPFDFRIASETYGPHYVSGREWSSRDLLLTANFHDPGVGYAQWEPDSILLRKTILKGQLPLWNPYVAGGAPFMANLTGTPFFPPYLALLLAGPTSVMRNVYDLGILWIGGLFTVMLLRRHGIALLPSLCAGVAFATSGALVTNVGSFIGHAAAMCPVVLVATEWLLERPGGGRVVGTAVIFGAVALCSFPPILVGVFGISVAYAVVFSFSRAGSARSAIFRLGRFGLAAGLGATLVSFYYVPAEVLVASTPQVRSAYRGAGLVSLPVRCVFELVSHILIGSREIVGDPRLTDPFGLHLPYVGVVVLMMACIATRRGEGTKGPLYLFSAGASLIIGMKLFGVPPVQWLGHVPGFAMIHFAAYSGATLAFILAILAAIGLEDVYRGTVSIGRLGVAVAAVGGALCYLHLEAANTRAASGAVADAWDRRFWCLVGLTVGVVIAVGAGQLLRRWDWIGPTCALAIVIAVGFEARGNNAYPRQRRWDVWDHPVPFVSAMLRRPVDGRALIGGGVPLPNANQAFNIASLDSSYACNPARAFGLYQRYASPEARYFMSGCNRLPPEGVLDRAAVSRLVMRAPETALVAEAMLRGYRVSFTDGFTIVFERACPPRVLVTSKYRVVPPADALEAMGARPVDGEVIVERKPEWPSSGTTRSSLRVVGMRLNGAEFVVNTAKPAFLYWADNMAPGWTARVNDSTAEIYWANYAFRAVAVPVGTSRVTFRYWPPGLTAGLALSGVGLAVIPVVARLRERERLSSESA